MFWCLAISAYLSAVQAGDLFSSNAFTQRDSILVVGPGDQALFKWRAEEQMIPASLAKLTTAYMAKEKWGWEHKFHTNFYVLDKQLWIEGRGDPYLISEELDIIAEQLVSKLPSDINSINLDANYFADEPVPGRTKVSDPYNAPLSAISTNFNTAKVKPAQNDWVSAEPQTPITMTVKQVMARLPNNSNAGITRINLINSQFAQSHFAEILLTKLRQAGARGQKDLNSKIAVHVNQSLPTGAKLLYRYENSHNLKEVVRGTLEYSNNFIANQLFLLLGDDGTGTPLNFNKASEFAAASLREKLAWSDFNTSEGSGLSRENRLSASQVSQLLFELQPQYSLFKRYPIKTNSSSTQRKVSAYAKSGTLDGVHNLAGYFIVGREYYRFVFMFNRKMPYRYRESLLQELAEFILQDKEL